MRYRFMRFPGGKSKAVTLSYDDGCASDMRMSDIISKYGLKCTFNLTGKEQVHDMTDRQIKEYILDRGHEIAIHGLEHIAEGTMRPIDGICDVLRCRLELEERFGIIIKGMAYPDTGISNICPGTSYETIKNYLTELDISYSRTLGGDNDSFKLPTDWHAWIPTAHHNNPKLMEYIDSFMNIDNNSENVYVDRRYPRLFYMWGHSFELDRDNTWELFDKICASLSGKDNVWYATNMEIYEYTNAYNSLSYSANKKLIYNPTLHDIWLDIDGSTIKISSGQTLKL